MKHVNLTQAKRDLKHIAASQEPVALSVRGQPAGVLRVFAEPSYDRDKALAAARGIRELSAKIAAKRKPSKKTGATQAVRDLRDHGE